MAALIFTWWAISLLVATAGLFIARMRHERPVFKSYAVVALVAATGGWFGNHGGGMAAVAFIIAGAFLLLHLASQPYGEKPGDNG